MPPVVARQILEHPDEGVIPAKSFKSASVAFIMLEEYESKSLQVGSCELITWLDRVYVAFDMLVDAYGERVNKIETVRDVWVGGAKALLPATACLMPAVGRRDLRRQRGAPRRGR